VRSIDAGGEERIAIEEEAFEIWDATFGDSCLLDEDESGDVSDGIGGMGRKIEPFNVDSAFVLPGEVRRE
jgi:hypothetical protein